jgi:hypothetical protein
VTRGIDNIDVVASPIAGGRGGRDGNAALLLLLHPVHRCRTVMDLTEAMGLPRVIENPLGRRRLARVDVGSDTDIPDVFYVVPIHHK